LILEHPESDLVGLLVIGAVRFVSVDRTEFAVYRVWSAGRTNQAMIREDEKPTPDGSTDLLHILDLAIERPLELGLLLGRPGVHLGSVREPEAAGQEESCYQCRPIIIWKATPAYLL
jgi:hypothetical protein